MATRATRAGLGIASGIAGLLLATAASSVGAASGSGHEEAHEPVPTGAELAERCADYREELAFTREQLKRRNLLGRWNFVVAEHRKREKFVEAHCGAGGAHGDGSHDDGGDPHHGARHADEHR